MANVVVRHNRVTGLGPNPSAPIDGPAWDEAHVVTGLENVDNTSDADKPVSTAQAAAIAVVQGDVTAHEARTDNPHGVTKSQVGLGNVDNTSDATKNAATATLTNKTINGANNALTVRLGNDVTGTLPLGNGGTGGTSAATARTSIMGAGTWTGNTVSMAMAQDGGATQGSFTARASGTGDANLAGMCFLNDAYGIKFGVRADGTIGWGGWSSVNWRLYQDVSGNLVATGNVQGFSDPRLKDDISRIENALDIVERLDGVWFTWNGLSSFSAGRAGKRDIGVLSDQIKAALSVLVVPSIEDENGETYDTVAYNGLVAVLIEAVKTLSARLRILEARR